jgi:hypothetical protein
METAINTSPIQTRRPLSSPPSTHWGMQMDGGISSGEQNIVYNSKERRCFYVYKHAPTTNPALIKCLNI